MIKHLDSWISWLNLLSRLSGIRGSLPVLFSRTQACDASRVTPEVGVAPKLDLWSEGHDQDGAEAGDVRHEGRLPGDQGAAARVHVDAAGDDPLKIR